MEARIAHLEGAFDQVGERLNSMDRGIELVRGEIAEVRKDLNQRFMWLTGIMAGTWVTMVGMWITTMLTILYRR
ncbi:MAG: hypothetical protein ACREMP_00765 [Candidatus Tyrphobacter sp.]